MAQALLSMRTFSSLLVVTLVAQMGNSRPWILAGESHGLTNETKRAYLVRRTFERLHSEPCRPP